MGKASKWICNFLLGKKEENNKRNDICFAAGYPASGLAIQPASTPKVRRRWSFGRSASKGATLHKHSKSIDSIDTTQLPMQTMVNFDTRKIQVMVTRDVEHAAATKIQAVFRSHLARKALYALRALVKLQALVRGHFVRKQTTATLRRMHALMAIQVRARVQRIQMAEEAQPAVKRQTSIPHNFPQENGQRKVHREIKDRNLNETQRVLKSKNSYLNHTQIEKIEHGINTFFSGNLSISNREHQYEEFSFTTAQNSPRHHPATSKPTPGRASFSFQQPPYLDPISHDYQFMPNYMANTESSRAKARSQSEPKQRPKWSIRQDSKRTTSKDETNVQQDVPMQQRSSSHSKHIAHENQDPWFIKLYQSPRSFKDNEGDSNSTVTSYSNYSRSLIAYEPHVTLY